MQWAKAVYDFRQRTKLKDDPYGRCIPPGGPRQFLGEQGFQFVDLRTRILVLLGDGNRNWRIIYTDGRPLAQPADVVSSYYGTSVGHWDKDALVVVFTCNSCIVAEGYEDRLIAFAAECNKPDSKVGFVAINVNTGKADALPAMKERATK